ncbi:MAG TPA: metalloregulator ArsR/SmtB family transcription factor [Gaiellaceae bacterium]|nr:metalloregulator ArsR/SmtB family transcription factor [Gaiellaceae bacterium]
MTETSAIDSSADLYEQFARIGKAVASARRVELLDLLCQGERSVEGLAQTSRMSVTNTSQHLQILRAAHLVETRKEGTKVLYRVANEAVCRFYFELRELAHGRLAEVDQLVHRYFDGDGLESVSREELLARMKQGVVALVDVRPPEEFAAGHIAGALSVPVGLLEELLDTLPSGTEIVAYCRGPYCLLASRALEILRANGLQARRLEDGYPEWRLAALPVAVGADEQ